MSFLGRVAGLGRALITRGFGGGVAAPVDPVHVPGCVAVSIESTATVVMAIEPTATVAITVEPTSTITITFEGC